MWGIFLFSMTLLPLENFLEIYDACPGIADEFQKLGFYVSPEDVRNRIGEIRADLNLDEPGYGGDTAQFTDIALRNWLIHLESYTPET